VEIVRKTSNQLLLPSSFCVTNRLFMYEPNSLLFVCYDSSLKLFVCYYLNPNGKNEKDGSVLV